VVDGLHVYGRLIGAEPVGIDRGLLSFSQSIRQSNKKLVTDEIKCKKNNASFSWDFKARVSAMTGTHRT